ncbi:TatD family hydrolase [Lederbergia wuyishanensis]|uniref:TatD DNase family protein n=1 Tax=Lederbergia wuyishanensis TaxID=1347903 RepID=A0ABU0D9V5_9BACI|nr:TatD family hydrolase [Lederbergia wuyishanensis]MCJ8008469.1 TatD family hydrolase [Lederbergia wuyishanensis]MDQ0345212.1 TatD DNase family protein [Lederbergia wuyishanensis]
MEKIADAHIHLDHYAQDEIRLIMDELDQSYCTNLISVSFDLESCKKNLKLAKQYSQVKPAFGFHPEQEIPSDREIAELLDWMNVHQDEMVAVGEVGLPYYLRSENPKISIDPYIHLLDDFLKFAKKWDKPVVLHAVYEDAAIVCDLLEKYNIKHAHFHWFKGDSITIERMIKNGYFISITPDVLYEEEIKRLVLKYPLNQMMVETDGPWLFEGEFAGKMTHPSMIHESVKAISKLKNEDLSFVYKRLYENTKMFYRL